MKRVLTLLPITAMAAAGFAVLAASFFNPVQATTFPSPRVIYSAVGVADNDVSPAIGTSVICMNNSGQNATVRVTFIDNTGINKGSKQTTLANGRVYGVGTDNGTFSHLDHFEVAAASNFLGRVNIFSTQSAVFCSAIVARSLEQDPGNSLNMVRFNAHPGTLE